MNPKEMKTAKISLRLDAEVHTALRTDAKAHGMELSDHLQRILSKYLIDNSLLDEGTAMEKMKMWSLIDRAVDTARRICREEPFAADITLKAFQECMKSEQWSSDYESYVKDNPYKHKNPRKSPINKEIGYRIREAIGGKVVKLSNGKPQKCPVAGEIIQSYTPMKSYGIA